MNLQKDLPAPAFKNKLIKRDQTTTDIAKLMLKCEFDSRKDVQKIKKYFDGENDRIKCAKVWHYLKKNIKYKKEPAEKQTAKTISRIVYDGQNGAGCDCKHYAIFSVCVLKALGVPVRFRLVSFDSYKKSPSHAYAVAKVNGREIIIDPCIENFNQESKYNYKFDISPI